MAELKWWQKAVFYQIYPRSFADGNGDGIGDFVGMAEKLDYLRDLGIDGLWLSPHYPSPFLDCGYDISDYSDVGPEYGTLDDFRVFLDEAHKRGIRVILDLVLNHTSDQHPWFIESKSSIGNPRRDWYMWEDGKDGGPPNNWVSIFGGSAWELDISSGQYYYHAFLKEQPDLNWRNPEVKEAMWDAVRFWLDMGVDGFRLDAIATIFENPALPNHKGTKSRKELFEMGQTAKTDEEIKEIFDLYGEVLHYQIHQPGMHELMKELRSVIDEYPGDRLLVGEEEDIAFHGEGEDELHLVFNFPLMRVTGVTPAHIRENQAQRLAELPEGAWPCNTFGNHDTSRMWTRYGDGVHDSELARLHIALLLTLKGTPFLYNGEEIGMTDRAFTSFDDVQDKAANSQYIEMVEEFGIPDDEALEAALKTTRDRCRTPLQWRNAPNAGFSPEGVKTWLPVNDNYLDGVNVEDEQADPGSVLSFYKRLLHMRKTSPALIAGDYEVCEPVSDKYLAFWRRDGESGQICLVALNFSGDEQVVEVDREEEVRVLFSTESHSELEKVSGLRLGAFEVFVGEVAG